MIYETVTSPESAKLDKIIEMLSCLSCTIAGVTDYSYDVIEHPVCHEGEWAYLVIRFENGNITDQTFVPTGVPCTEPAPVNLDFEIKTRQRCDSTTRTIWEQCYTYHLSDPMDPTSITELPVGAEFDTGIECNREAPIDIDLCTSNP